MSQSLYPEVVQTQPLVAELGRWVAIAKAPTLPFVLGDATQGCCWRRSAIGEACRWGFLTNRGEHVSRSELTSGVYRPLNYPAC